MPFLSTCLFGAVSQTSLGYAMGIRMKIISFREVMEWNQTLEKEGIGFRIHLRDACGAQAFWIEVLESPELNLDYEKLYLIMEEIRKENRIVIDFSEDKLHFWIVGERE